MPTIDIEKVLIPERACRCGGRYFVAIPRGETEPRTYHLKPLCPQLQRMSGIDFLKWNNTGQEDLSKLPKAPTVNRRLRRRLDHRKRVQARTKAIVDGFARASRAADEPPSASEVLERVRALTTEG